MGLEEMGGGELKVNEIKQNNRGGEDKVGRKQIKGEVSLGKE